MVPISQAIDVPWPRESSHKFSLAHDPRARGDFDGGSFSLATIDEWPISATMSGGLMVIMPGQMEELHWNPNADEFHYYLARTGQMAMFGSDGRAQPANIKAADSAYIPAGHGIINTGSEDLRIVQTWNAGKFEEISLKRWMQTAPRYLLSTNRAGVPAAMLEKIKQTWALSWRPERIRSPTCRAAGSSGPAADCIPAPEPNAVPKLIPTR